MYVLLLSAVLVTGCSGSGSDFEAESIFRGNLERTGVFPSEGPDELHELVWKFETDGKVQVSPAIADDTVYIGSMDHYVYAVDLDSGKEKWKFKAGNRVYASPLVVDSVVYIGSDY